MNTGSVGDWMLIGLVMISGFTRSQIPLFVARDRTKENQVSQSAGLPRTIFRVVLMLIFDLMT